MDGPWTVFWGSMEGLPSDAEAVGIGFWRVEAVGHWHFAIEAPFDGKGKVLACAREDGADDPRIAVEETEGFPGDGGNGTCGRRPPPRASRATLETRGGAGPTHGCEGGRCRTRRGREERSQAFEWQVDDARLRVRLVWRVEGPRAPPRPRPRVSYVHRQKLDAKPMMETRPMAGQEGVES